MGKYMRKAKVTGEVAVMEVVAQSTIGVRTRAKTLALQRLQKISSSPTTTTSTTATAAAASTDTDNNNNSGSSYFQLRSRKLERPPLIVVDSSSKKQTQAKEVVCKKNPNPKLRTSPRFVVGTVNSGSVGSVNLSCSKNNDENERIQEKKKNYDDLCLEASFGENVLDIEERDRSTRETTPCSLIRDPDTIRTPGSSTRPTTLSNRRMRNPMRGNIPTTREMDEFFANAEQQQQRFFTEKYNFDPVNDLPLPGRYEWVCGSVTAVPCSIKTSSSASSVD